MKKVLFLTLAVVRLTLAGFDAGIGQQAFFSGLEYTVETALAPSFFERSEFGDIAWTLNVNGSDLAVGRITGEDQKINFKVNDLRPGIVVSGELRFGNRGRRRLVPMHFFARDPFPEIRSIKRFAVGVYPADSPLNDLLEKYDLKYEKVETPEKFRGQVLFISGADFEKEPKLLETLLRRLPRGRKIVVLPPAQGTFKIPSALFAKITLLPRDGIREMRREFDLLPLAYSIDMQANGDFLTLKLGKNGEGSGGMILDAGRGGKLIFSGWSLDDPVNPTGIYLLRHYMRSLR